MLTNFRTVCRVPGADIHSVATCFHVMVDGPPTENNKIIHRHNYSLPHGRCLGPCGGHILASGKPRSAIYQQPSALKNLLGAEPMVPGSIQKISLQKHCKKKCWLANQILAQVFPSGSARHYLEIYAATKNQQEACLEHRPTAAACAGAGVRIVGIQFLGCWYNIYDCVMLPHIISVL